MTTLDLDDGKSCESQSLTSHGGKVSKCVFVGDAKYKRVRVEGVPNADLYQLLAYVTALDLPGGLLIYAQGESETATYTVRNSGKRLDVVALDLDGSLDAVLKRIDGIAESVKALRDEFRALRPAA